MSKFRFKHFDVSHDQSSMKVGTDALLIGAWTNILAAKNILDVGTGCGVIALMLAQRSKTAEIYGIDIDKDSIIEATENARNSPWPARVKMECISLQNYTPPCQFDLIVANPPFFTNGTLPARSTQKHARHNESLQFLDLVHYSKALLQTNGRLAVILPHLEASEFLSIAEVEGYYPNREMVFKSKKGRPVERLLLEFSFQQQIISRDLLVHYQPDGTWTPEYLELTQDFHYR